MARRSHSRPTAWISAVVVVALAVVVGVLVIIAIDRARPALTNESLAPIPTFSPAEPQSSPSPSPAPTLTPIARADERFLTASSEGVIWRGIAGSCADGADPLIERSTDGGGTWNDVTPLYRGVAQITRLDAFAGTQAQAVALLDGDCSIDGLRTFTQGRFWESYDEVLATSSFIQGDDPARVVSPDRVIGAPCDSARGLRGAGTTLALVCDGEAFRLAGDSWQQLDVDGAVAVTVNDSSFIVAHLTPDCAGLALTRVSDASNFVVACVEGLDPDAPTTIEVSGESVLVWSGSSFTELPL